QHNPFSPRNRSEIFPSEVRIIRIIHFRVGLPETELAGAEVEAPPGRSKTDHRLGARTACRTALAPRWGFTKAAPPAIRMEEPDPDSEPGATDSLRGIFKRASSG